MTLTIDKSAQLRIFSHPVYRCGNEHTARTIAAKLTDMAGSWETSFQVIPHGGKQVVWMFTEAEGTHEEILGELLALVIGNL